MVKNEQFEEYLLNHALHRCRRKKYEVQIQRVVKGTEYNVPGQTDVVYNFLEQCYESTLDADYIVTGTMGEMWPICSDALAGYEIDDEKRIEIYPKKYESKSRDEVYYYIQIDVNQQFELTLSSGAVLHGNAEGVEHDAGDYVVFTSMEKKDYRIINGVVFSRTYERIDV